MNKKMNIFKEISYYEKNILENRNEKASFYTNKEVAFFIIDELLKDLSKEQINKLSILEPSNGLRLEKSQIDILPIIEKET